MQVLFKYRSGCCLNGENLPTIRNPSGGYIDKLYRCWRSRGMTQFHLTELYQRFLEIFRGQSLKAEK